MLRAKIYVNEKEIDEIRILNIGEKTFFGQDTYKIIMPEGFSDVKIIHNRKESWNKLISKALDILNEKGYNKEHYNPNGLKYGFDSR